MDKLHIFSLTLTKALVTQLIGVLGIFFVFGFVLSNIETWTRKQYTRSIGWKGILWTGWIGTPIHELGHWVFCKIFGHRVDEMRLFQPDRQTGRLGHVNHSYNAKNLYHNIGNFFIGAAPMISGACALVLLLYFFVPNGSAIFAPLLAGELTFTGFLPAVSEVLSNLFSTTNLSSWKFWVFLYISFCISSHIAPSGPDRRGMWKGFGWLVLLLFTINVITLLLRVDITEYILKVNQYLGIFVALFTYATIISLLHLVVASVILYPLKKRG